MYVFAFHGHGFYRLLGCDVAYALERTRGAKPGWALLPKPVAATGFVFTDASVRFGVVIYRGSFSQGGGGGGGGGAGPAPDSRAHSDMAKPTTPPPPPPPEPLLSPPTPGLRVVKPAAPIALMMIAFPCLFLRTTDRLGCPIIRIDPAVVTSESPAARTQFVLTNFYMSG